MPYKPSREAATANGNIKNQRELHKTTTFQEEYVRFVERHDIEFERRILFEAPRMNFEPLPPFRGCAEMIPYDHGLAPTATRFCRHLDTSQHPSLLLKLTAFTNWTASEGMSSAERS
jgi:hypothetical protein